MEGKQKPSYDVVSLTRSGQEKRANYASLALHMARQPKTSGQFVRVFADVFLKKEKNDRFYF